MSRRPDPELGLLRVLSRTARGPRREGAFAVWLAVRVALDGSRPEGLAERALRRRAQALERRLSSLTLPHPLRRALQGTLALLRETRPERAALALRQLVAPVGESLGAEASEAVRHAAEDAERRVAAGSRAR